MFPLYSVRYSGGTQASDCRSQPETARAATACPFSVQWPSSAIKHSSTGTLGSLNASTSWKQSISKLWQTSSILFMDFCMSTWLDFKVAGGTFKISPLVGMTTSLKGIEFSKDRCANSPIRASVICHARSIGGGVSNKYWLPCNRSDPGCLLS